MTHANAERFLEILTTPAATTRPPSHPINSNAESFTPISYTVEFSFKNGKPIEFYVLGRCESIVVNGKDVCNITGKTAHDILPLLEATAGEWIY